FVNLAELTSRAHLYDTPLLPCSLVLLSAIPIPDPDVEEKLERIILQGDLPSPINPPSGCVFRTRCPLAMEFWAQEKPACQEIERHHYVACHLYNKKTIKTEQMLNIHIR